MQELDPEDEDEDENDEDYEDEEDDEDDDDEDDEDDNAGQGQRVGIEIGTITRILGEQSCRKLNHPQDSTSTSCADSALFCLSYY